MDTSRFAQIPIGELKPYKGNARKHSPAQINQVRASLRQFGFVSPAVIDADKNIICGHARIAAAKAEGYAAVPCVYAEGLTEVQKKAYALADNQLALTSEWDEEKLKEEQEALHAAGFDLSIAGFPPEALLAILSGEDVEDVEKPEKKTAPADLARIGDLWHLGRHRLICGDTTQAETLKTLMGGAVAGCIMTDPPYGISGVGGYRSWAENIKGDELRGEALYDMINGAIRGMLAHTKKEAAVYIWTPSGDPQLEFRRAARDNGLSVSQELVWIKPRIGLGREYRAQHERCLLYCLPQEEGAKKHKWQGMAAESSVLEYDRTAGAYHPTEKPVEMVERLIRNSTDANDTVLDGFAGGGSTLIACEHIGRSAYVAELDAGFASTIVKRYVEEAGTEGIFVERDGEKIKWKEIAK